ncbi:DASS family divalent anion:sodium (Na+) symporter [Propionibacterium freudenreichii subsp. freudenreichii]|uniref:DASS family divalent anion:sodium (Na+) symporter n=1 Tax=Propionibacterium freudenreichii subsp. freudenreichii TaxID=66712 RepID=A0A0B7NSY2_PROFF|nr:anion permease [Propionibacterium freudenreichii]CEP27020.1 DASS family divalent anion:sodium (Na+) symporter [Propionibacterium freudenreichii subsp. freudenreichii]
MTEEQGDRGAVMGRDGAGWRNLLMRLGIPVILGVIIWFAPVPAGLDPKAWQMLAIFAATILAIILHPFPMGAVTLLGMLVSVLLGVVPLQPVKGGNGTYALMGVANSTIWLIVMAFLISRGFMKTGLGRRIALFFISKLGGRMLGVSYGLALADLVMAPAIPSATARGGGIMTPIMQSVAKVYGSSPGPTARRAGAFLAINVGQVNAITCAMFLTAMAGNPLIASFAAQRGVTLSWSTWALGAIVPGLCALVVVPFVVYLIYPPELKKTPDVVEMAKGELRKLGPLSYGEKMMALTFVVLLASWTVGDMLLGISATTTGIIGVAILLIANVLTWQDIISEKAAWDTMIWFAILYMMATALNGYGLIDWVSTHIASSMGSMGWMPDLAILALLYFYSHYLFASATAHISAMYVAFLGSAIAVGAPPMLAALLLGYISNAFTSLTQYAGGASPSLFGTGYNTASQWWRVSAVAGLVSIAIWLFVGSGWMKLVGLW